LICDHFPGWHDTRPRKPKLQEADRFCIRGNVIAQDFECHFSRVVRKRGKPVARNKKILIAIRIGSNRTIGGFPKSNSKVHENGQDRHNRECENESHWASHGATLRLSENSLPSTFPLALHRYDGQFDENVYVSSTLVSPGFAGDAAFGGLPHRAP
jgi:hypothetical protein